MHRVPFTPLDTVVGIALVMIALLLMMHWVKIYKPQLYNRTPLIAFLTNVWALNAGVSL